MDNAAQVTALEQRLSDLERRLLRGRTLLAVLLGGLWLAAVGVVVHATLFRGAVTTQELILVDQSGRPRAYLDVKQDGAAYLIFYDAQGRERHALGVDALGQPALALLAADEKPRLALRLHDDAPSVHLADAQRQERLRLECTSASGPNIQWFDANGQALPSAQP